jgi:periplasmic copper chaperone A
LTLKELIDPDGQEFGRLLGGAKWDSKEIIEFLKAQVEHKGGAMHIIKAINSRTAVRTARCFVGVHLAPAQAVATPASHRVGTIVIEDPWSGASPGGAKNADGSMRIVNIGHEPDRLIGGAAADLCGLEVHRSEASDGFARMLPLTEGLAIQPGETIKLKSGSLHAMLVDLPKGPQKGDVIKRTLVFEKVRTIKIEYKVGGIGEKSAPQTLGSHHHH